MPRILVRALPPSCDIDIPNALKRIGHDLNQATGIGLDRMIILWEAIPSGRFLFNGETAPDQPVTTHHPMVDITAIAGMPEDLEKKMVQSLVISLSRELKVETSNICVSITTLAPGKLFVAGEFRHQPVQGGGVLEQTV